MSSSSVSNSPKTYYYPPTYRDGGHFTICKTVASSGEEEKFKLEIKTLLEKMELLVRTSFLERMVGGGLFYHIYLSTGDASKTRDKVYEEAKPIIDAAYPKSLKNPEKG